MHASVVATPSAAPLKLGERLLTLRWLAFAGLLLVVAHTTLISPRVLPAAMVALWSGLALLALVNIALSLVGPAHSLDPRIVASEIAFDVALITALLHTSGGLANPFAPLYVFHAVLAALLLPERLARKIVLAIAAVVVLLAAIEITVLPPGCVLDAGLCRPLDRPTLAGSGAAIALATLGSGLVVHSLVSAMHAERTRLETVVNCIADAVLFAAPDGRIQLANRAASALFTAAAEPHPAPRHEPASPTPAGRDLRVCHTRERWSQMLAKLHDPGEHEHHPILRVAGRAYEATYGRVSRDGTDSLGAVMVARDVTERLRDEELRAERERMATIGKLAAALAHEINNPLGTIQLYAQHLLKRAPADVTSEHLATILRNADVCKRIVRDLLEYARQRPPEARPVRPGQLLVQAARTLQPHADRMRVTLHVRAAPADDIEILADPDQVIQVLVNLGMNGIEAIAEARAKLTPLDPAPAARLELALARRTSDELALCVTDSGPGIAPAQRELVFEPFFTTKAEGTGLGLAVARDIASAHGGRLELESAPGGGTTFSLILPAPAPLPHTSEAA